MVARAVRLAAAAIAIPALAPALRPLLELWNDDFDDPVEIAVAELEDAGGGLVEVADAAAELEEAGDRLVEVADASAVDFSADYGIYR